MITNENVIIYVYDYLKKGMHYAILLYGKGINMQKKENVNIQLEGEQEQEHIFIGGQKLKEQYDWTKYHLSYFTIKLD